MFHLKSSRVPCFRDGPNGEVPAPRERVQRTSNTPRAHGVHAPACPDVPGHATPWGAKTGRLYHKRTANA